MITDFATVLFFTLLVSAVVGLMGIITSHQARRRAAWRQSVTDKLDELLKQ